ncbi:hypothetical protein [Leclercia adecarboxylata]|uniref:hypothetical protein n=1 Tax=Leclercia adecarboxylata TaxID=83655 RepID=UPI00111918EC|nr:hypothetical protein FHN83_03830 [Leclercia adecarboxylata]
MRIKLITRCFDIAFFLMVTDMVKKLLLVVLLSAIASTPALAINAKYRAQLERSGCNQQNEMDGSCDIHKSKAENQKSAELNSFLRDSVRGQNVDAAYNALEGYGFKKTKPLTWVKGMQTVALKISSADVVTSATVVH